MKKLIIVLLMAGSVLVSCKKEKTDFIAPPAAVSKKMSKVVILSSMGSTETEAYTYDAQGRLKEWLSTDQRFVFDYSIPGKLNVVKTDNTNGSLLMTYACEVNSKGNVTRLTSKWPDGTDYTAINYTYNTDDFITRMVYEFTTGDKSITDFVIGDGNVISTVNSRQDGTVNYTSTYTYDKSRKNTFNYTVAGYFPGQMFGKLPASLQTGYVMKKTNGTVLFQSITSWETDSDGYIKKYRSDFPVNGRWNEAVFTFQ